MKKLKSSILVSKEEEKVRLDVLLTRRLEDASRNYIHYLFEEGMILKNNLPVKKNSLCKQGDEIEVIYKRLPDVKLLPEEIALDILFEDEEIIAVNKPAGMVTHPAPGSYTNTFAGALLYYLKTLPESDDPLRPGIVHRLDKDTSGIILAAKTTSALKALQKMFATRQVQKQYLAVCHGYLEHSHLNFPIGRHPTKRKQMTTIPSGKEALTEFRLIEKHKGLCLIEAKPFTGRTHQIRVHAKHLKCPIVGDELYGPSKPLFQRHLLHANAISFIHPFSQKPMSILAPPPVDFLKFWTLHQETP